jgi:hypothetical protein
MESSTLDEPHHSLAVVSLPSTKKKRRAQYRSKKRKFQKASQSSFYDPLSDDSLPNIPSNTVYIRSSRFKSSLDEIKAFLERNGQHFEKTAFPAPSNGSNAPTHAKRSYHAPKVRINV